jgi:hypothetical protein
MNQESTEINLSGIAKGSYLIVLYANGELSEQTVLLKQ